ncbi:hypothetical protein G7Z17_g5026 [Cylindrodendrum hubeiense]|uniref:Uncharacterized protein n=1 Tax=Cylindrodendrum hubeiense TaxID=595255 RepID=A0A9P5HF09_9HYPO|nr:hypothetical protein G7Z17_g5026 [Cylindrodendrum hubeiense]
MATTFNDYLIFHSVTEVQFRTGYGAEGQQKQDFASSALPRNPTLESGNHGQPHSGGRWRRMTWMQRIRDKENGQTVEDAIEQSFERWVSQNEASSRGLKRLRAEYQRLKKRPAKYHRKDDTGRHQSASVSRVVLFSCKDILCHWTFKPPSEDRDGKYITGKAQTEVRSDDSFSDWLCRLSSAIQEEDFYGLQLISLTAWPESKDVNALFSFWHSLIATVRGRMKTIHLDDEVEQDEDNFARLRPLLPPSLRHRIITESEDTTIRVWRNSSIRPGNMDPDRGNDEIFLTWQSKATRYTSDLDVYIWEYHKKPPPTEYAKIVRQSSGSEDDPDKCVFEVIIEDTTRFVSIFHAELYKMVI